NIGVAPTTPHTHTHDSTILCPASRTNTVDAREHTTTRPRPATALQEGESTIRTIQYSRQHWRRTDNYTLPHPRLRHTVSGVAHKHRGRTRTHNDTPPTRHGAARGGKYYKDYTILHATLASHRQPHTPTPTTPPYCVRRRAQTPSTHENTQRHAPDPPRRCKRGKVL